MFVLNVPAVDEFALSGRLGSEHGY